jgi:hypothetical protein
MTDEPPRKPLTPKRGLFPTPKSELDKAKPYVPDADEEDEGPEVTGESPPRGDDD